MWGHTTQCVCPICTSLSRVFRIVFECSRLDNFVELAGPRFQVLEGQLRDLGDQLSSQGRFLAPNLIRPAPPQAAGQQVASPATAPAAAPTGPKGETATLSQPAAANTGEQSVVSSQETASEEPDLQLVAKAKPPEPPLAPPFVKAKAEEATDREPLVEASDLGAAAKEGGQSESSKPVKEKDRSKKKDRSRSRKRHKSKRRSSSRKRRRRDSKGEDRSPRSGDRRERKKRRTPSGDRAPPRPRTPERPRQPRSPSRPPPVYQWGVPQGRGWIGRVPYSSHPRWTQGENKGQVKRAKQERFNQRHGRR
jgi:hypothetical protein